MSGSMQLIAARNNFPDYDRFRWLDLGDIVEVVGEPVLSKTGERSLLLSDWKVLTKAYRAPPEKFAGIADQELKYRKRYLDLMSDEETRARFVVRSLTLRAIRDFMDHREFLEVETSTLNSINSGANAKPFTTHHNALETDLFLRIAPELYLKRLLVGGYNRVYEIGRNYRNEGVSTRHNPEFTMMESYQAYGQFHELITNTKALLTHIDNFVFNQAYGTYGWIRPYLVTYRRERTFTFEDFKEIPMHGAVLLACRKAGLALEFSVQSQTFQLEVKELDNPRLQKIDVAGMYHDLNNCGMVGEKLYVLFEHVVEPFLTEDYRTADGSKSVPVFITKYPKEVSPLARACDNNPHFCDRFELFVDGRELANAFQELNDPDEQAARFLEQLTDNGRDPMDFDADYVEALEHGMPPAIGFGMGIDRLVMLQTNAPTIKDVILFPTLKPIK